MLGDDTELGTWIDKDTLLIREDDKAIKLRFTGGGERKGYLLNQVEIGWEGFHDTSFLGWCEGPTQNNANVIRFSLDTKWASPRICAVKKIAARKAKPSP